MPTPPQRRTPAEILRILTEGTAAGTGDASFRSLARHAALALGARYAFVAETVSALESRSLAYWEGSDFGEGLSYRFPGTPCQRVAAAPEGSRRAAAPPAERSPERGALTLAEKERDHIVAVLEATGWVIEGSEGAACVLGIHASTLRSRLENLGVRRRVT